MKKWLKHIITSACLVMIVVTSCKDDDLVLVPEWETGVHGRATFAAGSATNYIKGDPSIDVNFDLLWNSIDQKNTVTKIRVFLLFNESYMDQDNNPKVAAHGGDEGVLFATFEGAAVPANKVPVSLSISQADVFELYQDAAYDYYGTGEVPVWGAGSIKAERNTTDKMFIDGDAFQIRWEFTTADGRVFDNWGISVCTEFPGANCSVNWAAICNPVIQDPLGDYIIKMQDSYGDGWNGASIIVELDGVETEYTIEDGSSKQVTITAPPGTESLTFAFAGGDWDSEVTFEIVSPKGNVIAKGGPSPPDGELTLNLCKE